MENLASEVDLLNLSPMDGSGSRGNHPRYLSLKSKIRDVGRVFVTGYDVNLPRDDVDGALRKLFSSCGLITDICTRRRHGKLKRSVIYIVGEGAAEKALKLSGSDAGGWKAIVNPYPFMETEGRSITVSVTGYDTMLSEIDIETALRKHFSSCGSILFVHISNSFAKAELSIVGEDAQDKAFELDGVHMGERKLLVDVVCGGVKTYHTVRHCGLIRNVLV